MLMRRCVCTMQHDASDCAAATISTILITYKQELSLMKIREIIGTDLYGTSVKGIVDGLEKLKFQVKAVRVDIKDLDSGVTYPAIAQVHTKEGLDHFVVIHKVKKDVFYIADPAKGNLKQSRKEFDKLFTGVLVVMLPSYEFEKMEHKNSDMWDLFKALILPQKKLLTTVVVK